MENSENPPTPEARIASLRAQRAGLIAALEMHVNRSEDLARAVAVLDAELEQVAATQEAPA